MAPRTVSFRACALVAVVVALISSVLVAGMISGADPNCCPGKHPYIHLYDHERTQLEAFLVTGDAQAFAALAQDPTLAHPEHIDPPAEYAYRAQRPVWGYLAWGVSFGQPSLAGWALVVLAILASGALAAVLAALAMQRGSSPWWGLLAVAAGIQTLSELTPELLAAALVGAAVLCRRGHRVACIGLLTAAALTRESMLVAVAMLALYELAHAGGPLLHRVRAALPYVIPFGAYAAWAVLLHQRLGGWPWGRSNDRLVAPFTGIADAWAGGATKAAAGFVLAVVLCVGAWALARRDALTWIASGYLLFALTFSADVWLRGGFERSLVPLYVFGAVAVVGGIRARRATVRDDGAAAATTVVPGALVPAGIHEEDRA